MVCLVDKLSSFPFFFTPGLKLEIILVRLTMVDVTNVLNGHLRQFKDLSLCTVLYLTLGVHNGDANTVCKGERASHFTGRGCFDDLSAGGVMKSVSLVFIPLSKGQFSQHSTYFHVVLNLA